MRHWLIQIRKMKGFTQQQVADLAGISRSYYADIEQGSKGASGKAAKLIANALDFDMNLFFAEVGLKTSQKKEVI